MVFCRIPSPFRKTANIPEQRKIWLKRGLTRFPVLENNRVASLQGIHLHFAVWRQLIIIERGLQIHDAQLPPVQISMNGIWGVGKTMSYVGKTMSDIIQTTSDLFFAFASTRKTDSYIEKVLSVYGAANQRLMRKVTLWRFLRQQAGCTK